MNLWYPIGLLISGLIVYWSVQDDRQLASAPDEFLRQILRGSGNFYVTLQPRLGRLARFHALELAQIQDADARQTRWEALVLAMPQRARTLRLVRWEIRFRGVAFAVFGLVLLFDWLA